MTAYLDHAATTPVRGAALEAFLTASGQVGNPSSSHAQGRAARRRVEEAREAVAAAVGAQPYEVLFTSGGTEADNLALKGLYWSRVGAEPGRRRIVVSAVEHHAVLDSARWLAQHAGAEVVEVPVDGTGRLEVSALADELARNAERVALISVMWANNEVGALQPMGEVAALAGEHGIPVHSDAVQAVGQVGVDVADLAALSLSGHKLGAPQGVGALLLGRAVPVTPLQHGGGQERGIRSGTVPAAAASALAAAVTEAVEARPREAERLAELRDRLLAGIREAIDGVELRGPESGPARLPGNLSVAFEGAQAEVLLYLLDAAGIAASSGSACQAGVERVSHVQRAMGVADRRARGVLRFSLGHTSRASEVDAVLAVLPDVVARARRVGVS